MNVELIDKTRIVVSVIFFFIWGCYGFVLPEILSVAIPIGACLFLILIFIYYIKNPIN